MGYSRNHGLVSLATDVAVVALETEFWRKLGESLINVHIDAIVLAAFFVWWLKGAAVGWAGEGEKFVEAVTEAFESAVGSIHNTI